MDRYDNKADWFRSVAESGKRTKQGPQETTTLVLMEIAWQMKTLNERLAQIEAAIKTVGR